MKTKEITLCGKQVTLAYCFATEISYKILSDEDITDFFEDAIKNIQEERMPDTRKSIYAILAAMSAYCDGNGIKDYPITDEELMFDARPTEIGGAVGTIIVLRAEFYHVPKDEPEDKSEKDSEPKNV